VQANNGLTALVDTAIAGTTTITMTAADYTLSTANGATDEARAMALNLTGTPGAARNVICPAVSKIYIVSNNTTGGFAQTIKTSAGTGVSVPNGATALVRCDGTNVVAALSFLSSLTLSGNLTVSGNASLASGSVTGTMTGGTYANIALTGTPTAPTATLGTSTTQLATTAFVAATSFSTNLPGQTGNAGKFLKTDGSVASWDVVYPSQTGNAGKTLVTDGTTATWQPATAQDYIVQSYGIV
jgi:hypothetical protein